MNTVDVSKRIRSTFGRYRLLWIAAVAVLLIAVALPDTGSGVVIMAPFTSDEMGIRGAVPQGWIEVQPGVFARGTSSTDQTGLTLQSAPGMTVEDLAAVAAAQLGLERFPERVGIYSGSSFTWDLYTIEVDSSDLGTGIVRLAVTESDGTSYVVALLVLSGDYDAQAPLLETVFFHAVYALAPVERSVADETRVPEPEVADVQLVPYTSQHFGLRGVVPEGWVEVEPGVFADVAAAAGQTALLQMSYPGITMDYAVAALPLTLGILSSRTAAEASSRSGSPGICIPSNLKRLTMRHE